MRKPVSPCLDCEVRMEGCHGYCGMYKEYTELQTQYRQLVKRNRWAHYGNKVEWSPARLKCMRKDK